MKEIHQAKYMRKGADLPSPLQTPFSPKLQMVTNPGALGTIFFLMKKFNLPISSLTAYAFCVKSKKPLPNPRSSQFISVFF